MKYEYVIEIEGTWQKQVQCVASSFEAAWDIARTAAKQAGGVVIQVWGAAGQ